MNPAAAPRRNLHLIAGVGAGVLLMLAAMGFGRWGARLIRSRVDQLALFNYTETRTGTLVQRAIAGQDGLLPTYGSSELLRKSSYRADQFFAHRPSGFAVAPVGGLGDPPLVMAERLASVGSVLRGRKVALLMSTSWFIGPDRDRDRDAYANGFSALQAGDLVFAAPISDSLRRRLARAMLRYPETLADEPLLQWGVSLVAQGHGQGPAFGILRLLWRAQSATWTLAEEARALDRLRHGRARLPGAEAIPSPIPWDSLAAAAEAEWRTASANNPFGMPDVRWETYGDSLRQLRGRLSGTGFTDSVSRSPRWGDFALLLDLLQELGAQPLLLQLPLPGPWFNYIGIDEPARAAFYDRYEAAACRPGFEVQDFRAYDSDTLVLRSPGTHPSPKGWILYDRALDDFNHGRRMGTAEPTDTADGLVCPGSAPGLSD